MTHSTKQTSPSPSPITIPELPTAAGDTPQAALAYLELTPSQTAIVAYALVAHCRSVGPPRTQLEHEIAGLRDFMLDLLGERAAEVLLRSA